MIDLTREYSMAETEYDLAAFDADPGMLYELTACYAVPDKRGIAEEVLCVRQTMSEIKDEVKSLNSQVVQDMKGLMVIVYEEDDSHPVPAYLVIRKSFERA